MKAMNLPTAIESAPESASAANLTSQSISGTQRERTTGSSEPRLEASAPAAIGLAAPTTPPWRDADALVLFYADLLDDMERVRIATENRCRSLLSEEDWGKGVSKNLPEVSVLESLVAQTQGLEHAASLALKRAMRAHPLGEWVKNTKGVGEKQAARLLAAIGNPADRPNVAKLWAFCGLHVWNPGGHDRSGTHVASAPGGQLPRGSHSSAAPGGDAQSERDNQAHAGIAPRRSKGVKANWSTVAKTRAYLVAESCMKQRQSPYRPVYDAGREKYAESVHAHDCPPCKAKVGEPLKDGHKHARAMRLVMKAVLRDLWIEARRIQGEVS